MFVLVTFDLLDQPMGRYARARYDVREGAHGRQVHCRLLMTAGQVFLFHGADLSF